MVAFPIPFGMTSWRLPSQEPGSIIMWSGLLTGIPEGYRLCDGTHGTPDLRDKFIIGAGSAYAVADEGGSADHNHVFTGSGHSHGLIISGGVLAGAGNSANTDPASITGTSDDANSRPPYFALAYLMATGV